MTDTAKISATIAKMEELYTAVGLKVIRGTTQFTTAHVLDIYLPKLNRAFIVYDGNFSNESDFTAVIKECEDIGIKLIFEDAQDWYK